MVATRIAWVTAGMTSTPGKKSLGAAIDLPVVPERSCVDVPLPTAARRGSARTERCGPLAGRSADPLAGRALCARGEARR